MGTIEYARFRYDTVELEYGLNSSIVYKTKQIPRIDIFYSQYSRKNRKTTEPVIFRLYSKDIVIVILLFVHCQEHYLSFRLYFKDIANVFKINTKYHRLRCFLLFREYREYKMSIFGIYFISIEHVRARLVKHVFKTLNLACHLHKTSCNINLLSIM